MRGFSKSIKEIAKGAIIVVVSVAFIYTTSCCGACSLPPKVSENISAWETGEYKGLYAAQRLELFAVRQEDVGRYEKVNFYISEGKSFFEYADYSYCLQLEYEEKEYLREKEETFTENRFLETVLSSQKGVYEMPITECGLGSYQLKILDLKKILVEEEYCYLAENRPRFFGFVAFNDKECMIRYCYLVSMSLDYFTSAEHCIDYIENSVGLQW